MFVCVAIFQVCLWESMIDGRAGVRLNTMEGLGLLGKQKGRQKGPGGGGRITADNKAPVNKQDRVPGGESDISDKIIARNDSSL